MTPTDGKMEFMRVILRLYQDVLPSFFLSYPKNMRWIGLEIIYPQLPIKFDSGTDADQKK